MRWSILVSMFVLQACADPIELQATGRVVLIDGEPQVEIVAMTSPGARVTGSRPDQEDQTTTADADGRAVLHMRETLSSSRTYYVRATHGDGGPTVEVEVPESMRFVPTDYPPGSSGLACRGSASDNCSIRVTYDGAAEIREAASGTIVESRGASVTVSRGSDARLELDLTPSFSTVDVGAVFAAPETAPGVQVPITVRFPSGNQPTGELLVPGPTLARTLARYLESARTGGVEPGAAPTSNALVVVGLQEPIGVVLGRAANIRDVRWVAAVERRARRIGSCGVYRGTQGPQAVTREATDLVVRIVERQHGTAVSEQTFVGTEPACGFVSMGREVGPAPSEEALRWIRGEHERLAVQ